MKKFFACFVTAIFAAASIGFAADNKQPKQETLIDFDTELNSAFCGALDVRGTTINSNPAMEMGGHIGWVLNNTFTIGFGGLGITSNHNVKDYRDPVTNKQAYLRAGYGGLFLEYTLNPSSLIHFTFHSLIGAGGAVYTDSNYGRAWDDRRDECVSDNFESSAFFVFEPGLGVEMNVTSFLKLNLNAGYRIASGLDLPKTENKDLSGPYAGLSIKFGNFSF